MAVSQAAAKERKRKAFLFEVFKYYMYNSEGIIDGSHVLSKQNIALDSEV